MVEGRIRAVVGVDFGEEEEEEEEEMIMVPILAPLLHTAVIRVVAGLVQHRHGRDGGQDFGQVH